MKVALVRVSSYQSWYRLPSIGLSYLAAALEREGIDLKIFDARYFYMSDGDLVDEVQRYSPEVIGLTAMTHEIKRTAAIAGTLKEKLEVPIVIGGCHITAIPTRTLEEFPAIDYAVIGEGENTLLDIIKCLNGNKKIEDVKGVAYRSGGRIVLNEARESIVDLDSLPFPAYHRYFTKGRKSLSGRNAYYQLLTSRGCPFDCAFCMRVLGKTVRRRSADSIIDEIDFAVRVYGAHTINFADEVFLFNNRKTKEILNRFIERGIPKRVRWAGLTRSDLVDRELVNLAKRAGCYRLEIGVESGNDEILRRIGKNTNVEQIRSAVRIIKDGGLRTASFYILGHPGEDEETVGQTINLAADLNTDTIAVGIMVPYPGTRVSEWAEKNEFGYRIADSDWDDYDKFGHSPLEIEGFSMNRLEGLQRRAYIYFYLKNFRMISLLKFVISRYRGIAAVFKRQFIEENLHKRKVSSATN